MHDPHITLILTFAAGLAAALTFGVVTHKLGLSPIVGYLLAGIVLGPHTPGFNADAEIAAQMAEVGVILLMFGVGLHFHLDELLAVRRVAVPGAIAQSAIATGLGALVGLGFGWPWWAGVVFGLSLSVASTVVLVRVLTDNRDLHTPTGHIAVGWLVVEDLFTVLVLVLLPAVSGKDGGGDAAAAATALAVATVKVVALVAFTFLIGARVIPWFLEKIAATGSRELFTLAVLVVALGIAIGSTVAFGVSMALGAFLGGMVVGRSEFSLRAAADALPMRDAFAVLFFVSVGMQLNPKFLIERPLLILATLAVVLIGKPLAALAIVLALRYPLKIAAGVAVALAQIGEFSFILATLGATLELLPDAARNALVAVAIVSISLNPLAYRLVDRVDGWTHHTPRLREWLRARTQEGLPDPPPRAGDPAGEYRAVVIGYGPVGQTVSRLLRENDIEPTIVEMNLETVRELRADGVRAVYGDATHRETLKEAGVATAGNLILSSAGMHGSEEVIRIARELNPDVRVLARANYVRELPALRGAGAEAAFAGELEVALSIVEAMLRELGATPEQIDRERDRVQRELIGQAKKQNGGSVTP